MERRLEKAEIAEHVKTKFRVHVDESNVLEMELVRIDEGHSTPRQEQFSLIFECPHIYLPQRIYRMEHERMGNISLFLVPIGKIEDNFIYEAVFNRMIK